MDSHASLQFRSRRIAHSCQTIANKIANNVSRTPSVADGIGLNMIPGSRIRKGRDPTVPGVRMYYWEPRELKDAEPFLLVFVAHRVRFRHEI